MASHSFDTKPYRRFTPRQTSGSGEKFATGAVPTILQRHAEHTVRTHFSRAIVRYFTLFAADFCTIAALRGLVHVARDGGGFGTHIANIIASVYPRAGLWGLQFVAAILVGLMALGNYAPGQRRRDAGRLFAGSALGLMFTFWGRIWASESVAVFIAYLVAVSVLSVFLIAERAIVDWLNTRLRSPDAASRVLVVGRPSDARHAIRAMRRSARSNMNPIGFLDVASYPAKDALGGVLELVETIARERVDTIVFAGAFDQDEQGALVDVADKAGCQVIVIPGAFYLPGFEPRVAWFNGLALVELTRPALRGQQLLLKRALDLTVSIVLLVLASPILISVAIAVKATSRGPIFFRQRRVGFARRFFPIYKFRSMRVDAEERRLELMDRSVYQDGRLFKIVNDPRITKLGAFLRRTSLDELPQLLNVLRGEMSLVGPRPPMPSEVDLYEDHHFARFDMRPGITGPWQVSGRNNITDFETVVRLESEYMRQWNIWKDLTIILRTIPAVFRMEGAH